MEKKERRVVVQNSCMILIETERIVWTKRVFFNKWSLALQRWNPPPPQKEDLGRSVHLLWAGQG